MEYSVLSVLQADLKLRYNFFNNRPWLYIYNMILVYALGIPVCIQGVGFFHETVGMGLGTSVFFIVMCYWFTSLFWCWRLIRCMVKSP